MYPRTVRLAYCTSGMVDLDAKCVAESLIVEDGCQNAKTMNEKGNEE